MGAESVVADDLLCEIELLVELALQPELLDEQHDKVTPRLKEARGQNRTRVVEVVVSGQWRLRREWAVDSELLFIG